jgi:hypothetical protein
MSGAFLPPANMSLFPKRVDSMRAAYLAELLSNAMDDLRLSHFSRRNEGKWESESLE